MPILSYCWSVTLSIKSVSKNWNLEILDDNHWDCIAVVGESFLIDVNENTNLNTSTVCISFLCSYIVAFFKYVNGTCIVAYIYIYIYWFAMQEQLQDYRWGDRFFSSYEVS